MSLQVRIRPIVLVLVAALVVGGCAHSAKKEPSASAAGESRVEQTPEYEAILRESITRELLAAARIGDAPASKILFKRPYYFKEYFSYPNAEDIFVLDFTETESRTIPLTAEANVEKIRFSTRVHQKREDARIDENFLRDTGIETISYELRNGKWHRQASLFVADKTEENISGEWQSIRDRPERHILEPEQPKGGWRRLLFWR